MAIDFDMTGGVLYTGTYGPEDPTRATLALAAAIAMKNRDANVPVALALLGQGVLLVDDGIAGGIKVAGARSSFSTILQMMETAEKAGIKIPC
jgi:predicted peroxiredoxin